MDRRAFLSNWLASKTSSVLEPLDVEAGLEPYSAPLDERKTRHLLRRSGFGAGPDRVGELVGTAGSDAAVTIVNDAVALSLPDPPFWHNSPPPNRDPQSPEFQQYIADNNQWLVDYRYEWIEQMYMYGLRERLALFWHDHFATSTGAYFLAPFAYQHLTLLRSHALGDFKQFVHDVGVDPAMLLYLNGTQNEVGAPNENYARELLELFTMGQLDSGGNPNYSENDIQEIARALTGWKVDFFNLAASFNPIFFDSGVKTFLGRTGSFGYADVVDILFEERGPAIAEFIATKLYTEFVYVVPDPAIVSQLAQTLVQNGFQIAPVVSTLLQSAHFFDDAVVGARIKGPVELVTGLLLESHAPLPPGIFSIAGRLSFFMEQVVLNPPNVAGWPGHHSWVSTTTLPIRWLTPDFLLTNGTGTEFVDLVPLAESLHDPYHPHSAFVLAETLARHFIPVPLDELDIPPVDGEFAGDLITHPIPDQYLNGPQYVLDLTKAFLNGLPWHDWYLYEEGANIRVFLYLRFLFQLPEFQLT